ncbi:MAG: hypothetical protein ACPLN0_01525 [Candidatus Hydrothermia bacterium]
MKKLIFLLILVNAFIGCKRDSHPVYFKKFISDVDSFISISDSLLMEASSVHQYQMGKARINREIQDKYIPRVDSLLNLKLSKGEKNLLFIIRDFLVLYGKMDLSAEEEVQLRAIKTEIINIIKREYVHVK